MKERQDYIFLNSRLLFVIVAVILTITLFFSMLPIEGLNFAGVSVRKAYAENFYKEQVISDDCCIENNQNNTKWDDEDFDNNINVENNNKNNLSSDTDNINKYFQADSLNTEESYTYEDSLQKKLSDLNLDIKDLDNIENDTYSKYKDNSIADNTLLKFPEGTGTPEDPYLVSNTNQFECLRSIFKNNANACVKLTADISNDNMIKWEPFCDDDDDAYCGIFDGNNHIISLSTNGEDSSANGGLFRYLGSNACIKNLTIDSDLYIESSHAAVFACDVIEKAKNVTIEKCVCRGQLKSNGGSDHPDGAVYSAFIAWVEDDTSVTIQDCINNANIFADNHHTRYAAGFIGFANDSKINIINSSNNGEIDASGALSWEFRIGLMILQFVCACLLGRFAYKIDQAKISSKVFHNAVNKNINFLKSKESIMQPGFSDDAYRASAEELTKLQFKISKLTKEDAFKELIEWKKIIETKYVGDYYTKFSPLRLYIDDMLNGLQKNYLANFPRELQMGDILCNAEKMSSFADKCGEVRKNYFDDTMMKEFCNLKNNPEQIDDIVKNMQIKLCGKSNTAIMDKLPNDFADDFKKVVDNIELNIAKRTDSGDITSFKINSPSTITPDKVYTVYSNYVEYQFWNETNLDYFTIMQLEKYKLDAAMQIINNEDINVSKTYNDLLKEYCCLKNAPNKDVVFQNQINYLTKLSNKVAEDFIRLSGSPLINQMGPEKFKIFIFRKMFSQEAYYIADISRVPNSIFLARYYKALDGLAVGGAYQNSENILKSLYEAGLIEQGSKIGPNTAQTIFTSDIVMKYYESGRILETEYLDSINQGLNQGLNLALGTYVMDDATLSATSVLTDNLDSIFSGLSKAAESLATGEGGLGGIHYNGYGAGIVGYCDGDNGDNKLYLKNCTNNSSITGGHNAGGLVAFTENYNVDIISCSNFGSISCTDNMMNPSSGGLIGSCTDAQSNQTINIIKSINSGTVLSRKIAGGIFGRIYDKRLIVNITDCGSVGGIAGTDAVGGFVGWEDSIYTLNINNCYSYTTFNTTALNKTQINWSWVPLPGLSDWTTKATESASTPGAFIGKLDNTDCTKFNNCYYLIGNRAVGPKDDSEIPYSDQLREVADDDFRKGYVTYELNREDVSVGAPFGQIIDDLSLGNGISMQVPMPGLYAPIYKDTHSSSTIYSNYNPRTIKLFQVQIFAEHASIEPKDSVVNVKQDGSYEFYVDIENAFLFDSAIVREASGNTKNLEGQIIKNKSKTKVKFSLTNIKDNLMVNIKTKPFEKKQPQGLGNAGSPFLISNISELSWFIENINSGMAYDLCAKLTNDIDVSAYKLTSMLNNVVGYKGIFDGDGHIISNITSDYSDYSFFRYVDQGTIKNLTLSGNFGCAAFAEWAHDATFINCISKGNINSNGISSGGICSKMWGTKNKFESCINECSIKQSNNDRYTCAGGICGLLTDGTITDVDSDGRSVCATFKQCINRGTVCSTSSFDTHAAGIIAYVNSWNRNGKLLSNGSHILIDYCENAGNIYGEGDQTSCGGIMGCVDNLDGNDDYSAKVDILHTINTGNIGYDSNNYKKDVQDAAGIICWTYDHSLDLNIDSCIVDGNIWCPDTFISGGSGCGGFIANGEYGHIFNISNSYTTGHITSNHNNKGYFIGTWGTPIVFRRWFLLPFWFFNVLVASLKDSYFGYAPKINLNNNYYVKGGTPDKVGGDSFYHSLGQEVNNCHQIQNSDLSSGALAYKINTNKDKPVFGQNIDIAELEETLSNILVDENGEQINENGVPKCEEVKKVSVLHKQDSPCIIGLDQRKTAPVYEVYQDNNKYYTNYSNKKLDDGFNISAESENGFIKGKLSGKLGEDLKIIFCPKNNGYCLSEIKVDDEVIDNVKDMEYTFKSINKNHKIYAKFVNEIEPQRCEDIDGYPTYAISKAQEYIWFANQINNGKRYNAKLVNDINLTNCPECPQIKNFKNIFCGQKSECSNYSIYRDTNSAMFNDIEDGKIENIDIVINSSNTYSNTAALCKNSNNLIISNVNISGNMHNVSGHSAAYVAYASNNIKICNCSSSVNVTSDNSDKSYIGIYLGQIAQNTTAIIEDCNSTGFVNASFSKESIAAAAIAFAESESTNYNIKNFKNDGFISACWSAGSIFGEIDTKDTWLNKSNDYNIDGCVNTAKISAQNSGGLIGSVTDTEDAYLNISRSENSGNIYSINKSRKIGDDANSGGLIGYLYDLDIDINILCCSVTCTSIKSDGKNAGGFIGYLRSNKDEANVLNSFMYCTNISAKNYSGLIFGNNSLSNQRAKDVYVYKPSGCNLKWVGNKDNKDQFKQDIITISYEEFSNGCLANKLNYNIKNNDDYKNKLLIEDNCDVFGQIIDLNNALKDNCPHINGKKLYQIEKQVKSETIIIYSNYSSEQNNTKKLLSFINEDKSTGTSEPASDILISEGTNYTIKFNCYGGNYLEKLVVNGETITDNEVFKNNKFEIKNIKQNTIVEYKIGYGHKPEGEGTEDNPYCIVIPSELMWISKSLNNNSIPDNVHIKIMNDIDMFGIQWSKIKNFKGFIDGLNSEGNSSTINNIKSNESDEVAMFQWLDGACIQNINFNVEFSSTRLVGGLAIHTKKSNIINTQINGCLTTKDDNNPIAGGFSVYEVSGGSVFEKCISNLNISCDNNDRDTIMGGFIGTTENNRTLENSFKECINLSNITSNTSSDHIRNYEGDSSGGFIGKITNSAKNLWYKFSSCINLGQINGDNSGGFVGNIHLNDDWYCYMEFNMCSNYGSITGDDVGGFIGRAQKFNKDSLFHLKNCMNYGNITASYSGGQCGNNAGGFIGLLYAGSGRSGGGKWTINFCGNLGIITTYGRYSGNGGIVAESSYVQELNIYNSYSAGKQVDNNGSCRKGRIVGQSDDIDFYYKNLYGLDGLNLMGGDENGNNKGDKNIPGYKSVNESQFTSGYVAWMLNREVNINENNDGFRQVLDDFTTYSETYKYPDSTLTKENSLHKVYKLEDETFSNFDPEGKKTENNVSELHTINFEVAGPGTITPIGCMHKYSGESLQITAKPNNGCVLESLILIDADGNQTNIMNEINYDNTYVLSNIRKNYKINASFAKEIKPVGDGINIPYKIKNYNELLWVAKQVNIGNSNINIDIENDINAYSYIDTLWVPIGSTLSNAYCGEFNGNGHYITGLTAYTGKEMSMFRYCNNAYIHDLSLKNIYFWLTGESKSASGLCYKTLGTTKIKNIIVEGKINASLNEAGLINYADGEINIESCYTNVEMSDLFADDSNVSGGINYLNAKGGNIYIKSFVVGPNSKINSNNEASGYKRHSDDYASGVISIIQGRGNVYIDDCVNLAVVKGMTAGGIVSEIKDANIKVYFTNCLNSIRVIGNNCGGILGKVENVDYLYAKFKGCNNTGYIGFAGSVIETAGSMVGYIEDKDATFSFEDCVNYGNVLNLDNQYSSINFSLSTGGLGFAFCLTALSTGLFIYASAAVSIGIFAFPISVAVALVHFAFVLSGWIENIIESRAFVNQYAGGMVGYEDDCKKITFKNVVNVGAVSGTTKSNAIGEFDDNVGEMSNVYVLDNTCENLNTDDGAKVSSLNSFASGKIGFNLQNAKNDNTGDYGFSQRIDLFDNGPKEYIPSYSNIPTHIYKYDNIYSNLDRDIYKKENYLLNIKYVSADDSLLSDDISEKFESTVEGDRLDKHKKIDTINTESNKNNKNIEQYQVLSAELNTVKIKPKSNNVSIVRVELYDQNSKLIDLKDDNFIFYAEGSVDIIIPDRAKQDTTIKAYCVNNGIHYDYINGTNTMMLPWNSSTELPDEKTGYYINNYYLTNDINTTSTFKCMKGKVNICLNGHSVSMLDESEGIIVNDNTSDLNIIDCNATRSLYKYKTNTNNQIIDINKIDDADNDMHNSLDNIDTVDKNNNIIKGGIIYGTSNNSLISVMKGALTVDSATLINNSKENPVILFSAPFNENKSISDSTSNIVSESTENTMSVAINNNLNKMLKDGEYGNDVKEVYDKYLSKSKNPNSNKEYNIVDSKILFNSTILNAISDIAAIDYTDKYNNDKLAPLTFGPKTKFINSYCANLKTSQIVNFSDDYKYEVPISVICDNEIILTKDFDKQISEGIDYRQVFTSFDKQKLIVLSGNKDSKNYNNLKIINKKNKDNYLKDSYFTVYIPECNNGHLYPSNFINSNNQNVDLVKYDAGSDIKLHLEKDQFNTVDKIKITRNDIVVKTYDSTYIDNTLIYNGEVTQEYLDAFPINNDLYETNSQLQSIDIANNLKCLPIEAGEEISIEVSFKPQIESVLQGEYKKWESTTSLPNIPGRYTLLNDVELGHNTDGDTTVWEVPEGVFTIDLNGHKIKQTAPGKNAVHVSNDNTVLTFTDSTVEGKSEDEISTSMYVQKQIKEYTYNNLKYSVETFQEVTKQDFDEYNNISEDSKSEETKIYEVKGGAICGANVEPQNYYAFNTKAGAIIVDKGVFYMHSGNICANNAGMLHLGSGSLFNETERYNNNQGVEGGAAITANENANVFICENANIAYNSITGDKDYNSLYFSAGIASKGTLDNKGDIYNNIAFNFASSAIAIEQGSFSNSGKIYNNISKNTSFGTVFNAGKFVNSGSVTNNISNIEKCGVVNCGDFTIEKNSKISGNVYSNSKINNLNSDIYLFCDTCISISPDLIPTDQSVVNINAQYNSTFTLGWSDIDYDENAIFASFSDDLSLCMDSSGELMFAPKDQIVNVDFEIEGMGKVTKNDKKIKSGKYFKGINLNFNVIADNNWIIDSVKCNETDLKQVQSKTSKENADSSKEIDNFKDNLYTAFNIKENCKIKATFVKDISLNNNSDTTLDKELDNEENLVDSFNRANDSEINAKIEESNKNEKIWQDISSMPTESGSYKLDIKQDTLSLYKTWEIPENTNINLDLNGTILKSKFDGVLVKISEKSNLFIYDSKNKTHKFQRMDDGRYKLKEKHSYHSLDGGIILGYDNGKSNIAFDVDKDSELTLSRTNVVGFKNLLNTNTNINTDIEENFNMGLGGAIFNRGRIIIDKFSSICGNVADIAGGIYNKHGIIICNGNIYNNAALKSAGGIYNDGIIMLCEFSNISDNKLLDNKHRYKTGNLDDIVLNTNSNEFIPYIVLNKKFNKKHTTYLSTTNGCWYENIPMIKNGIKIYQDISTFIEYFNFVDSLDLKFVENNNDISAKK